MTSSNWLKRRGRTRVPFGDWNKLNPIILLLPSVYKGTSHLQSVLIIADVLLEAIQSFHVLWCQLEIKPLRNVRRSIQLP